MLKTLGIGISSLLLSIGSLFGIHQQLAPQAIQDAPKSTPTFGAFNPTGGGTYRLGQSIGTTDTTIKLSSFKEPVSNIAYTMSYLNSTVGYGTLSPQSTISEFISFTGITQNSDGSATLTGVTRGLTRTPAGLACTASTTLQQGHAGQSIFILSNSPCFYAEYATKQNNENISGVWNFQSLPTTSVVCTSSVQFCNKSYIDAGFNAGAATSTETNGGIVELGTLAEQAASFSGGASKPTVLQTKNATSACQVAGTYALIASSTTGKLDGVCFDPAYSYTFSASTTHTKSITLNATTTIAASSTTGAPLILNGVALAFPSSVGAASTTFINDGSGNVLNLRYDPTIVKNSTTHSTSNTSTTTLSTYSIPANSIGPNGMFRLTTFLQGTGSNNNKCLEAVWGTGTASTTLGYVCATAQGGAFQGGMLTANIRNVGSVSSQVIGSIGSAANLSTQVASSTSASVISFGSLTSYSTAAVTYIGIRGAVGNGGDAAIEEGTTIEILP